MAQKRPTTTKGSHGGEGKSQAKPTNRSTSRGLSPERGRGGGRILSTVGGG
jgi:hypothetical protein